MIHKFLNGDLLPRLAIRVRGVMVLDMGFESRVTGVQFPASARYRVMLTLSKSTLS